MDPVAIGRWQFGITTVYHYLFVPITIAMSMLVAIIQTAWVRTGKQRYLQLTKFFGKLFLINFALGVVTGIVQEFQFGMNWSEYSRFVGDIFGAPLALEALLAFFLESTFIGLWIFGWDRLPKKVHLAAIYLAAIGTILSASFILAANSWMQNPVGSVLSFENGRAELDGVSGFLALLSNPVFIATFIHTITAAYMVGGGVVAGVSTWHLAKTNKRIASGELSAEKGAEERATWRWAAKLGAWVLLIASVGVFVSGDMQSKVMTEVQPMKMAAAEGLFESTDNAPFSILTVGTLDGRSEVFALKVPGLLSMLSGHDHVHGFNDLEAEYKANGFSRNDGTRLPLQEQIAQAINDGQLSPDMAQAFAQIDYVPPVVVSYWSFRIMIGLGMAGMAVAALILLRLRNEKSTAAVRPAWWWTGLMWVVPLGPLFANSFGWIFTEMGRQPWLVAGVMPTAAGISPSVTAGEMLTSLIVYTLLYGALAVLEVWLFMKYLKAGLPEVEEPVVLEDPDAPLTFAY
ncbi:cytochrome ubiquinol oxidase subunit I [Tessaracoccus caeni]|uniref:cytochrome ubiquinol oxidase subunit I n=1 Tax=Tessaracoccus caeni TaxID=3031239 RepID=UPI0023DAB0FE|nr:cytochrome ubiquinol oxidase subunit I [Tessaracoccus caeni]MDF1487283.1 cytochrome ubiquinol oxidase subunit I [Tessaracoccus caeni]